MVAPSFQSFEILCEPYEVSGKQYIRVRNPKTGTERQVRWYSEAEYIKSYGAVPPTADISHPVEPSNQKLALGFKEGYIYIYLGITEENEHIFRNCSSFRYTRWWGWYSINLVRMPLPESIRVVRLDWKDVGLPNGALKPEDQVTAYIDSLQYEPSLSNYVGNVGERIEIHVKVEKAIPIEDNYGKKFCYVMVDRDGNEFVWITAAKAWDEDSVHLLRGTVKEHKIFRNSKQTVLSRCTEIN